MKPNNKLIRQAEKIQQQINAVRTENELGTEQLRHQYNVTDTDFSFDVELSDDQHNFLESLSKLHCEHEWEINQLNARRAALLLLAYHIARRGHILHQSTMERKLKRIPQSDAKFIAAQIRNSVFQSPIAANAPYLHQELKKRKITFLDMNYLQSLLSALEKCNFYTTCLQQTFLSELISHKDTTRTLANSDFLNDVAKQIRKELSLFHKALHKKQLMLIQQRERATEIPF